MLILLNGGNFSLTVLVHNMFLISIEKHQTQPKKSPQGTQLFFTSHSSVQIEGHILGCYHFLIQWTFFLPWRRSKKLWINRGGRVATQLPKKALPNHWFLCIRYVTNPQLLKHTSLSQFEGQFNSSETNYSIPFERWCNRLSFLSNSCFISSRFCTNHSNDYSSWFAEASCGPWGTIGPALEIWWERWCWTDATPSHPEICPNVGI